MIRCADAVFQIVKQYTDTVFFVPGGGCAFLVDALGQSGLKHISMLHEQSCGYAAIGDAQARKRLGVCLVTSGPGSTNAVTPCLAAWTDSVPVLFISGTPNSDTLIGNTGLRIRGVQECNIIEIVKPITKRAFRPMNNLEVVFGLESLISLSLEGRCGPTWLDIPLDIQSGAIYDINE